MNRPQTRSKNSAPMNAMLPTPPSNSLKVRSPTDSDAFRLPAPLYDDDESNTKSHASPAPPRANTQPKRRNHSDIERRRRIKINGKYDELRQLVPSCASFRFAKRGGDSGLHKLDILSEAVEYIKQLQGQINYLSASQAVPMRTTPPNDKFEVAREHNPAGQSQLPSPQLPSPQLIALASEAEKLAPLPVPQSQKPSIAHLLN